MPSHASVLGVGTRMGTVGHVQAEPLGVTQTGRVGGMRLGVREWANGCMMPSRKQNGMDHGTRPLAKVCRKLTCLGRAYSAHSG